MSEKIYDLIVVGAGPCGLAAAIDAQRAGLSCLILEKGSIAESIRKYPLNMTFFSTSDNISIGDIPFPTLGPKASRNEALEYYRKVADYFDLAIQLYTPVDKIEGKKGGFTCATPKGAFRAKSIALAIGYFDNPRKLNIPGADLPHVQSYYSEAHPCARMDVAIIGGGNSAVEAALDLHRHGARVSIIVRKEGLKPSIKYWLTRDIENRIKEGKINLITQSVVEEITADTVEVRNQASGELQTIPADFVFSLVGYTSDTEFLQACGIQLGEELIPEFDAETYQSNIPGIYLAGTVTSGIRTERVFIENGRLHGKEIVAAILAEG